MGGIGGLIDPFVGFKDGNLTSHEEDVPEEIENHTYVNFQRGEMPSINPLRYSHAANVRAVNHYRKAFIECNAYICRARLQDTFVLQIPCLDWRGPTPKSSRYEPRSSWRSVS